MKGFKARFASPGKTFIQLVGRIGVWLYYIVHLFQWERILYVSGLLFAFFLVSVVNNVSPLTGSFLPLAGRVFGSVVAVHLNLSNQSSSMAQRMLVGRVSFHKHFPYRCQKVFVCLRSTISSSVYLVDSESTFNALRRLSWSSFL